MSSFKFKDIKKNKSTRSFFTLDTKHKEMLNSIDLESNDISKINKKLENCNKILEKFDTKIKLTPEEIHEKAENKKLKRSLEDKLKRLENSNLELEYFDKTSDLLCDYYKINKNEVLQKKKIGDFFNKTNDSLDNDSTQQSKLKIFENYMKRTEGVRIKKDDGKNRIKYCPICSSEKKLLNDSCYICESCGHTEYVILEESQIKEYSAYKRLNHFKEWLTQIQGLESTDISDDIYQKIIDKINKLRISDLSLLNNKLMRQILKELRLNKYYEHIPYITNKLNDIPPPRFSRNQVDTFLKMFILIQEPWEKFKDKQRKNFLSYGYILHKFCELLELDEFLSYFPLLKSDDKLKDQDKTWKKICLYLDWEYYSSIE